MVKYRLTINRDLCIDCGIATGHCPHHARVLARILSKNGYENELGIVFSEKLYDQVKQAAEGCPVKAILIEKIEE
ncbi:ferredoxin [Candidatus Bathyarchaeota archaeon]|nr:MAG: ferredoxin [Candidatus Bathyarchaeota archaeon]